MKGLFTAAVLSLALASPASATLFITSGTFGGGNQGQVLFDTASSGTTIFGDLNAGPQNAVQFTSSTDTLNADASGQAVITASNGTLNQLTISAVSPLTGFEAITFNVNNLGQNTTQPFTISAVDQGGEIFTADFIAGAGENFVQVLSDPAQFIVSVSLSSALGVLDVRQVRVETTTTPVPGPIAGAGLPALLGLGAFVWARRRKAAATA
jgi:hypothetical protein